MTRTSDFEYSARSRHIEWRLDIYFNGTSSEPLSVTRNNYLISSSLLEEASASSNTPWGDVSANELTATLHNAQDIFNPGNISSPYYLKIRTGILIKVFCRPVPVTRTDALNEYAWDALGSFYVAEWNTASNGRTVSITCFDKISDVLNGTDVRLRVLRNTAKKDFVAYFFDELKVPVSIDDALYDTLPFGYHTGTNSDFLNNAAAGMFAWFFCDHTGLVRVQSMMRKLDVAHTITDSDQVINIAIQQGITMDYDGIEVHRKVPQLSSSKEVLVIKDTVIPSTGLSVVDQQMSSVPVADITLAGVDRAKAMVDTYSATATDIDYHVSNTDNTEQVGDVYFYGRTVDTADTTFTTPGSNLLKLDNVYVQTLEQLNKAKLFLSAYVSRKVPILEVDVRGNPRFQLGEKIRVSSERFNITFDGVLIRQNFQYDGGLSGTITLLNSEILEVT